MDLEVVGRHAMLFDDDGMAAFVNSSEALVEWNSLSIDRYDVRHLLSSPLPPRLKRRPSQPEPDIDHERYLHLPSSSSPDDQQKPQQPDDCSDPPPNEKVHQIILRTAMFVSKHGSQSEIILRVKQGDNPTFGFLMPDHHLHAYFRYLVGHQELLKVDKEDGSSTEEVNRTQGLDQKGGALSLLGSLYGSGEDEDGTTENTCDAKKKECEGAVGAVSTHAFPGVEQAESCSDVAKKDGSISKNPIPSLKEKVPVIKRNNSIISVKTATTAKAKTGDGLDSVSNAQNKSQTSVSSAAKIELPVVEPPSDLKRAIEKIVEFIVKNGKQFEAVLAEQDRPHGRFPFLLPSNRYHTYYLKVLQTAEESKLSGKGYHKRKPASRAGDKNIDVHEESDDLSHGSMASDLPHDMDRKEKFKMSIGKSKKDGLDPIPKDQAQNTVSMDAAATAAILQAATRGIKNPNLEIFTKTSSGSGHGLGSDGGYLSSSGSLYSSQPLGFVENRNLNAKPSASVPVAKAIAEKVAIAAAGEADSSEAHMTKEQKLKAERLKRAKMFAAMLKGGVGAVKSELPRALSVEPPGSGLSGSDAETGNLVGKEREGSSVPCDVENSDKSQKSDEKLSVDNSDRSQKFEEKLTADNERRSKRKYRSRSSKHEEEEEEEGEEENKEDKRDRKRSRKKHRSHRSSHSSWDRQKHKRRHSSSRDRYSYRGTKHDSSSDDEHLHSRHCNKYDSSSDEKHHSSRRRHREDSLSEHEQRHSRRSSKHYSSSDDEHTHRSRSVKHKSTSRAERETDPEEGEIVVKSEKSIVSEVGRASREASVGLSNARAPSKSTEITDVSDELRAKIRAMLMANL